MEEIDLKNPDGVLRALKAHQAGTHVFSIPFAEPGPGWLERVPLVTKSGRELSDADIEALADEAERGYCVAPDASVPSDICGHTLPCPEHGA